MYSAAFPKKTHNQYRGHHPYSGYLLAIASISLLLFALTSGIFNVSLTSNEQVSHTSNELSAAGSGGIAAGHGVNVTTSRAGGAVFDVAEDAEGAGNTDMTRADFSGIGGAKSGSQEPESAWQEPDAEDGSDGAGEGGMAPSGVYMVEAEPDTPYIFSARGISSDLNLTYEPLVTAMEVDGNGRKIVEHNLSFSGCYDWATKEITFITSPNVSEFYVSMNAWECNGTFQVEDVVLEVYEAPLPGISDLGHTAGRTWINWTWANPDDARFAYVTVHLNGTYMGVTPDPFYNATGLNSGVCYEIGVRTVDVGGNVSETEINQTAETAAEGDDELTVRAYDGLEFSLAESGAVSGVSIDGSEMPMLSVPGGFSFRDVASTTSDISLEGVVEKNHDGSITQYVTSSDIAFRFDYMPGDRYIEVHGEVQDLRGVDRAIQVQYVLPVDATGWQWGDYIRESREIGSGVRYENVYRVREVRTQNTYPFTFVGEDAQGLSLAVPMDVPRIYRIGYDTDAGGYSIEYDFGLANCTDKIGAGHANFTFIVYKVDEPEWGFRAVAKKYYELYPEFFVKQNEREGLWICGHDPSDIPEVDDFGFAFDDEASHISVLRRVYDHQHGIYPMQYAEPWGWWRSFGDNSTEPSYDKKIATLLDDYENGAGTWRGVVTTKFAAEAGLNSAPYDENGSQYLNHSWLWREWGIWSQNYPTNPDPDIPSPNRYDISYAKYLQSNEGGIYADNWTIDANCSLDTIAHSGNYSGKIEIPGELDVKSGALLSYFINVSPSAEYNFSAWGKTMNCGGSNVPAARIVEYNSDGAWIAQKNLYFSFGTADWTQKSATVITTADTAYIGVYANIWYGYGTFWFDDVELYESGNDTNLVENHGFESLYDASEYPCSGFRIDSLTSYWSWPTFENYRREHWEYTNHPLVFSYDTKKPVLIGAISQHEYVAKIHENMTAVNKLICSNIFRESYSFYGHLVDVLGSEFWDLRMYDDDASLRRTMSYQKTNANLLQWNRHGNESITNEEMENYMNDQMFYGMFPSIWIAASGETYADRDYWDDATLYERDRDLFKKYIPIIKNISATGWEPIPYATCDNPNIKFERYGDISVGLYYTVASCSSMVESGVLLVDLSKLGFDGTTVEVEELVANAVHALDVEDGQASITIPELHTYDTMVYKITP